MLKDSEHASFISMVVEVYLVDGESKLMVQFALLMRTWISMPIHSGSIRGTGKNETVWEMRPQKMVLEPIIIDSGNNGTERR